MEILNMPLAGEIVCAMSTADMNEVHGGVDPVTVFCLVAGGIGIGAVLWRVVAEPHIDAVVDEHMIRVGQPLPVRPGDGRDADAERRYHTSRGHTLR